MKHQSLSSRNLRLGGVALLLPRVTLPLLEFVLGLLEFLLGRINQHLPKLRVLLEELFERLDTPLGSFVEQGLLCRDGQYLGEQGSNSLNRSTDVADVQVEEVAQQRLSDVQAQVKEGHEQLFGQF